MVEYRFPGKEVVMKSVLVITVSALLCCLATPAFAHTTSVVVEKVDVPATKLVVCRHRAKTKATHRHHKAKCVAKSYSV